MLGEDRERTAFELLWAHGRERQRTRRLPEALRPKSRREGYAIEAWIEAGGAGPTFGWKLAATSREGQAHIGVDGPLAGRLLAERVVPSGATVPLGTSVMRVVEVEFVFRLQRDLVPRAEPYTVEEAMEAVEALHLGLELPDSRLDDYAEVGAPELLADAACANHFVLGPPAPEVWRSLDLSAHPVRAIVVGRYERQGSGCNVLGDPRVALAWLANELSEIGAALRAGEVVTTGTCVMPMAVEPGDEVIGDFGRLGQVTVRLS